MRSFRRPTKARRSSLAIGIGAVLFSIGVVAAQTTEIPPRNSAISDQQDMGESTSLSALIEEAERNNPEILAARHSWRAATQASSQVSTLPDPQINVQQFAVGSPRPFAGFTNSDFGYIGVGVSQDIPFPGKLRLRGEAARREAASQADRAESTRRTVVERLKIAYFQLAYEGEELSLLDRDSKLLDQVAQIAEANYRVGKGNQQDVLKAQLEKTKLLAAVEMRRQQQASLQAKLKQFLNRRPGGPRVNPEVLTESPVHVSVDDLLGKVRTQNPDVRSQQQMVRNNSIQLEIAHKDFYPDFTVQYMWQHTAAQYRDYYMLTVGARIPIYRTRKQRPAVEQAVEELHRSRRDYEAQIQESEFDIRDQYLKAQTAGRILKIYREGLIPQAANTFQAGLAAYEASKEDFETLLNSFLDVLRLDEEYWRSLLDHEVSLAGLERVTGVHLNGPGK